MKKRTITIALLLMAMVSGGELCASMTLKEAVGKALASSNAVKSSQLSVESRQANVDAAYGRLYPTIGADFFYTYLDKDIVLDLDPIRSAMIEIQSGNVVSLANIENTLKTGTSLTDQQKAAYKAAATQQLDSKLPHFTETVKERAFPQMMISLNQPIFTGGKIIAGINAAKLQEELEMKKSEDEMESVTDDVIRAWLNLELAKENVRIRQEVNDGIQKHLDRANKLFEQGLIPKNDRLRAEVALADAKRNLFEAKEKEKIARFALSILLDVNDENIDIVDSINYRPQSVLFDDYFRNALNGNKKLEQARIAGKALGEKANVKFADYMPTVFAYGFYNVFDNYIADLEPKWGVGVGAHLNIFNGFQRSNEYEEASLEQDAMLMKVKDVEKKIELLVRSKFMEMKLSEEKYLQLDASLEQTHENLRLYEKRYETGLGTTLEVIDARLAAEAVSLKRIQALTEYYINMSSLYSACGNTSGFLSFVSGN